MTDYQRVLEIQAEVSTHKRNHVTGLMTKKAYLVHSLAALQVELAGCAEVSFLGEPHALLSDMTLVGEHAQMLLEENGAEFWRGLAGNDRREALQDLRHRLARIQIEVFSIAQTITEISGKPFSPVEWALRKTEGNPRFADGADGPKNGGRRL